MPNRFEKIAATAREQTNQDLHEQLAEHVEISDDDLANMLPTKGDKENFARLMGIVHDQTSQNQKIAALKGNIDSLGEVLLKVLRRVT